MPNTKSPKTTSYRICKTDNKNHLNGIIILTDFEDNTGLAVVYVSELRPRIKNTVWHVSAEFIEYDKTHQVWKTCFPHNRYNEEKQEWIFKVISSREAGPPNSPSKDYPDNGEHYEKYIEYKFINIVAKNGDVEKADLQGEGTGTAGNTDN